MCWHLQVRRQTNLKSDTQAVSGPFKANSRSRYVELVLVVDNKSYESQDKDLNRVFRRCKDIANIVNAVKQLFIHQLNQLELLLTCSTDTCSCTRLSTSLWPWSVSSSGQKKTKFKFPLREMKRWQIFSITDASGCPRSIPTITPSYWRNLFSYLLIQI